MEPVAGLPVRGLGPRLRRRAPRPRPHDAAASGLGSIAVRWCCATSGIRARTTSRAWPLGRCCGPRWPACSIRASRRWPPPSSSTSSSARPTAMPPAPGHDELEPAGWYLEDYQLQQGARTEDFHAAVRRHLDASGVPVESSKGEWGLGQHEVNVRYAEVLETADRHTVFKQCLKEIGGPPGRQRDVHGQAARRSGRVELPRAPQPVAGRSERLRRRPRPRRRPGSRLPGAAVVPRRLPPLGARAGRAARPHGELLQAVRRGVVGTHPDRLELRQPHGRVPAGRRRPEPAHRVPHPRGRLQPVPGARRARRGRLGRDRAAGRTTATVRRRCLRRRVTRSASPHPPRRHRRLRDQRAGRRAPWEPRWSSTTRRRSAPSRPPSTPP